MDILATIVPIFAVVLIGWWVHSRGLLPGEFFGPANRLVFYVAIPAMVFSAIAKASLRTQFNAAVVAVTLGCILVVGALTWGLAHIAGMERSRRGAFIQNSFHGNQGYIGLAVAFYYLGAEGFARASIITGFMMILNNALAVLVLQVYSGGGPGSGLRPGTARKVLGHPIILSALAGILFSLAGVRIPLILDRCLTILSGMALPMALLIIGASLTFDLLKSRWQPILTSSVLKLLIMPGLGLAGFQLLGVSYEDFIPALILLATPTATVAYVMAREMNGDADFAVGAISASTLLSAVSYSFWLTVASRL
jgi:malate permease and related proteins